MILNEHGLPLTRTPMQRVDNLFSPDENVFEGMADIKLYEDAIAVKGICAHCLGPIEGVMRFPPGYKLRDRDMVLDARNQIIERVKKEHYCIPRIDGPKLPAADFLKRFE